LFTRQIQGEVRVEGCTQGVCASQRTSCLYYSNLTQVVTVATGVCSAVQNLDNKYR